jgi:hypothetical protein
MIERILQRFRLRSVLVQVTQQPIEITDQREIDGQITTTIKTKYKLKAASLNSESTYKMLQPMLPELSTRQDTSDTE